MQTYYQNPHVPYRNAELQILHQAFDRVAKGTVEVILVKCEPGIGKPALTGGIHKPIVEKRGYLTKSVFTEIDM